MLAGISEKSTKIVASDSDNSLDRLLHNLNNGFHYQEKKLEVKNNAFSSGMKKVFPLAAMKNFLKNI